MAILSVAQFPDEPDAAFDIEAADEYQAAEAGGDEFPNDGRTGLYVNNASGAAITVTALAARNCDQGFSHDQPIAVPAGSAGIVATEFENNRFTDPSTGRVALSYSAVASVSVAAVRLRS